MRIPQNPGLGERSDDDDPQNPGLGERSNLLGEVSRDMGIGTHPGIRKLVRIPQNPGLGERSNLLGEASRDTGIGAHPEIGKLGGIGCASQDWVRISQNPGMARIPGFGNWQASWDSARIPGFGTWQLNNSCGY